MSLKQINVTCKKCKREVLVWGDTDIKMVTDTALDYTCKDCLLNKEVKSDDEKRTD